MGPVWAVVVAGGAGTRFGGPKQYAPLAGRPLVSWSVGACRQATDGVVLVVAEGAARDPFGADVVVTGGPTRAASVRRGLAAVPADAAVVVVHDAARPLATAALVRAVVGALDDPAVDGAVCACALADTVKRVRPVPGAGAGTRTGGDGVLGDVAATLDRDALVAVQTPQAFRAGVLRRAHRGDPEATDDAALVERLGATVRVVAGDPRNLKVTTPADLALAEQLLGS